MGSVLWNLKYKLSDFKQNLAQKINRFKQNVKERMQLWKQKFTTKTMHLKKVEQIALPRFALVLVLIALVAVVGVSMTGYTVSLLGCKEATQNLTATSSELGNLSIEYKGCISALETCNSGYSLTFSSYDECTKELNSSRMTNEFYKSTVSDLRTRFDDVKEKLAICESNRTDLENKLSKTETELTTIRVNYETCGEELETTKTGYEKTTYNLANQICCIQRQFDKMLTYYYIKDNTIKCTSGYDEALGTKEFDYRNC